MASSFLQSAGKFFDNRSFPRAADGEVTDADDETAEGAFPENTLAIKKQSKLHQPLVNERQQIKK